MSNFITGLCGYLGYFPKTTTPAPKRLEVDVLMDRLYTLYGISPADISKGLDEQGAPSYMQRFPEIFENHNGLAMVAMEELERLNERLPLRKLSEEQRRRLVARRIAKAIIRAW